MQYEHEAGLQSMIDSMTGRRRGHQNEMIHLMHFCGIDQIADGEVVHDLGRLDPDHVAVPKRGNDDVDSLQRVGRSRRIQQIDGDPVDAHAEPRACTICTYGRWAPPRSR